MFQYMKRGAPLVVAALASIGLLAGCGGAVSKSQMGRTYGYNISSSSTAAGTASAPKGNMKADATFTENADGVVSSATATHEVASGSCAYTVTYNNNNGGIEVHNPGASGTAADCTNPDNCFAAKVVQNVGAGTCGATIYQRAVSNETNSDDNFDVTLAFTNSVGTDMGTDPDTAAESALRADAVHDKGASDAFLFDTVFASTAAFEAIFDSSDCASVAGGDEMDVDLTDPLGTEAFSADDFHADWEVLEIGADGNADGYKDCTVVATLTRNFDVTPDSAEVGAEEGPGPLDESLESNILYGLRICGDNTDTTTCPSANGI